ncbi:prepilin-type N-terminal cleavage/methylation domain-containing protein [Candidatus Saccharibacteria bacterium TM7i]|nr:prepilin-type N-terminal cleavage/methylation domain-containing protein [Candidatus Saccharibacteria bacterium TM7i]
MDSLSLIGGNEGRKGFTIVELTIVIAVIGILVAVGIIGYGPWQKSVRTNQVKSDLKSAAAAMEDARNFSNEYPASVGDVFSSGGDVQLTGGRMSSDTFCITGKSVKDSSIVFKVGAKSTDPAAGECVQMVMSCADSIFYQPFMRGLYVKFDCATPTASEYKLYYRDNRGSGWVEVGLASPDASGWYFFDENSPLTLSYMDDQSGAHGGAVKFTAVGSDGSAEDVINYGAIQE